MHLSMWSTHIKIQPDCCRLWLFKYAYCTNNSTRLNILSLHYVLRPSRQLTASELTHQPHETQQMKKLNKYTPKQNKLHQKNLNYELWRDVFWNNHLKYSGKLVSSVILTGIHSIPVSTAKFNSKSNAKNTDSKKWHFWLWHEMWDCFHMLLSYTNTE